MGIQQHDAKEMSSIRISKEKHINIQFLQENLDQPKQINMETNPHKINNTQNYNDNNEKEWNTLEEEEGDFCVWDEEDVKEDYKELQNSMMGKFLSGKVMHKNFIAAGLTSIWCEPKGIQIN